MLRTHWQKLASGTGPEVIDPATPVAAALEEAGVLRFAGSDVVNFLQGYLTIDSAEVGPAPKPAALTNLKGRVVANGWALTTEPDTIDWIIHGSLSEAVCAFMSRYLAFSRTELRIRDDDCLVLGLAGGEQAPSVALATTAATVDALLDGRTACDAALWTERSIDAGLALVSAPTSESFLPQMLGLVEQGAVDFDKGCYLGQEVVARAQHRGEVKRQLTRLTGEVQGLTAGTPVTDADGRTLGAVINVGQSRCQAVLGPGGDSCYAGEVTLTRA